MKCKTKKTNIKLSLKQKVAFACFMEAVPSLIALWESKKTDLSFDKWLMTIYEEHNKQSVKGEKK